LEKGVVSSVRWQPEGARRFRDQCKYETSEAKILVSLGEKEIPRKKCSNKDKDTYTFGGKMKGSGLRNVIGGRRRRNGSGVLTKRKKHGVELRRGGPKKGRR